MASAAGWLLLAVCVHASAVPLSTQLSEEEEKVTRCIMEVLAESLTVAGAGRVSSHCLRILREDQRIVSILRHQHLLRELEGLTHEGETQPGGTESSEEEELRKRDGTPKRDETPKRGAESEGSRDHQETREFEKIETVEVKEHKESAEEKDSGQLAEGDEDEEKRSPSVKREEKRSSGRGDSKRRFSEEDEAEEDEADRGFHGWRHGDHDGWEDKRATQKRTARDPSDEETEGLKLFHSKGHAHREAKRHFGPGEPAAERHRYNGRPGGHGQREEEEERELEEMEEREEREEEEEDLQELEKELRRAAERLQELRHG